ncbi:MAG: HAD family hydrolase [Clostridia bacterium]|nr:HAD family hydrolase [Clostridia bacterium]
MEIKNIIFDLDNTLIKDVDEDILEYKKALSNLNYDENDYSDIYSTIDMYESTKTNENIFYSKDELIDFINKNLNKNYSVSLIDELNKTIVNNWSNKPLISKEILEKLSNKYTLYVFSNWFKDAQISRLEKVGFSKYFKDVFTPEYYGAKPFKKSFKNILNKMNCSASECMMIGDSLRSDITGALNSGLHAILFSPDYKDFSCKELEHDSKTYTVINNFEELNKILF